MIGAGFPVCGEARRGLPRQLAARGADHQAHAPGLPGVLQQGQQLDQGGVRLSHSGFQM